MAIVSNYGTLKAEMNDYLFHQKLATRYDSAIDQFERAANTRLRVRQQEAFTDLTVDTEGTANLPADYLLWRTVLWTDRTPAVELDYVHPAWMTTAEQSLYGTPSLFMIVGPTITVKPVQSTPATVRLHYYQKIPSIVTPALDAATTNWLITEYPNVYIYGVFTELAAMQRNVEMAQLYKARRDEAFAEIMQLSALTTGPAAPPPMRTAEYF